MNLLIKSSDEDFLENGYSLLSEIMKNHFAFEGVRFKEVFTNPEYFKENKKGLAAALVFLTPDEYMSAVELHQKGHTFSQEKLEGIRDFRDAGNKLEAPFLEYGYRDLHDDDNYKHFAQEGYNRAYYMQMMGVKEIPVFIRYREGDETIPDFIREKLNLKSSNVKDSVAFDINSEVEKMSDSERESAVKGLASEDDREISVF